MQQKNLNWYEKVQKNFRSNGKDMFIGTSLKQ